MLGTIQDITEMRAMEEELMKCHSELKEVRKECKC